MECRTVRELLVPWLEDELAPAQQELMNDHIERCSSCADLAGRLSAQDVALSSLPPEPDPRLATEAFWAKMDTTLSEEWEVVAKERASAPPAAGASWLGQRELRVTPVGLVAYAAALLLALAWGFSNQVDAQHAEARAMALQEELHEAERATAVAVEPLPARPAPAYQPVSYTPRRGTL